jgi:hypothetical protein
MPYDMVQSIQLSIAPHCYRRRRSDYYHSLMANMDSSTTALTSTTTGGEGELRSKKRRRGSVANIGNDNDERKLVTSTNTTLVHGHDNDDVDERTILRARTSILDIDNAIMNKAASSLMGTKATTKKCVPFTLARLKVHLFRSALHATVHGPCLM